MKDKEMLLISGNIKPVLEEPSKPKAQIADTEKVQNQKDHCVIHIENMTFEVTSIESFSSDNNLSSMSLKVIIEDIHQFMSKSMNTFDFCLMKNDNVFFSGKAISISCNKFDENSWYLNLTSEIKH